MILFVADFCSSNGTSASPTKLLQCWRLQNRKKIIRTVKYADDLVVLLTKEVTVLQGICDRFTMEWK